MTEHFLLQNYPVCTRRVKFIYMHTYICTNIYVLYIRLNEMANIRERFPWSKLIDIFVVNYLLFHWLTCCSNENDSNESFTSILLCHKRRKSLLHRASSRHLVTRGKGIKYHAIILLFIIIIETFKLLEETNRLFGQSHRVCFSTETLISTSVYFVPESLQELYSTKFTRL